MAKAELWDDGKTPVIFCPACKHVHVFDARWQFDGNLENPTFHPSMHVNPPGEAHIKRTPTCHSLVRDGKIEYLNDCTHEMAGQTVELPDFKEATT